LAERYGSRVVIKKLLERDLHGADKAMAAEERSVEELDYEIEFIVLVS
jgi:hypothetical protein